MDTERDRDVVQAESDAIVRELAECGPTEGSQGECVYCGFVSSSPDIVTVGLKEGVRLREAAFINPSNHEPSCLWRRARALYPKEPV